MRVDYRLHFATTSSDCHYCLSDARKTRLFSYCYTLSLCAFSECISDSKKCEIGCMDLHSIWVAPPGVACQIRGWSVPQAEHATVYVSCVKVLWRCFEPKPYYILDLPPSTPWIASPEHSKISETKWKFRLKIRLDNCMTHMTVSKGCLILSPLK